ISRGYFRIFEVRNSKASGYCLDQGSEDDDKAILYPCHGMSSQYAYQSHRSTVNTISAAVHYSLSHLENKDSYIRILSLQNVHLAQTAVT
ncbi:hypothetical protein ATANTOWER_017840, partial [Ataeniobius toweri]|nr:hypothetical protein [Ataeniobius toweri]